MSINPKISLIQESGVVTDPNIAQSVLASFLNTSIPSVTNNQAKNYANAYNASNTNNSNVSGEKEKKPTESAVQYLYLCGKSNFIMKTPSFR